MATPNASIEILQLLARAHLHGTRDEIPEFAWQSKDGRKRYLRVVAHPVEETPGSANTVQMIAVDVTALVASRLQAEELAWELAEEQELYQATFRDAPVGIVHLDLDRNVTQANDRLLELFRCSLDELLLEGFGALRHPEEPDEEEPWAPTHLEGDARSKVERRYLRRDGTTIWTTVTVSLVRDRTGLPKRYVAIVEDVSELMKANERLEESSRSKDEFLAVLGHELRNPLAALRHASMVLTDVGVIDEPRGVVEIIDRQTKHMGRLVDDLLDIGRIARGKLDFRMEKVDFCQTVSFALDDLKAGRLPSQSLKIDLQEGPHWVDGDSARLLQAVQNILNNAVKYTPEDGDIQVMLASQGDTITLEVRDSGIGLDPSFIQKLFLPFEQAPQDISRSQGGLGLGLALTSQILKHHRGSIHAHSPGRGQGATFTIHLPLSDRPPKSERTPSQGPRRRLRFLVIEDNRDAAELLEMLLAARGHEVALCSSGDRALEASLRHLPDVILCDLGLPGISGFEVAQEIRKNQKLASVLLIALSGYGRDEDIARSKQAGFAEHLTKPVDLNEIFTLLDRLGMMESEPPRSRQ
jgi:PAS domain S-box-containing protein